MESGDVGSASDLHQNACPGQKIRSESAIPFSLPEFSAQKSARRSSRDFDQERFSPTCWHAVVEISRRRLAVFPISTRQRVCARSSKQFADFIVETCLRMSRVGVAGHEPSKI